MGRFMEEAEARKKGKAAREAADLERRKKSREAFESSGAARKSPSRQSEPAQAVQKGALSGADKRKLLADEGITSPWRK